MVISSSSWTRRIAKPRLKFAARMVYRETFLQIHKRLLRQLTKECSIPWVDFPITGNIPVQASTRRPVIENVDRENNRSWAKMVKIPNSFSISSSNFWLLKRPSTGILTLFQKECIERTKEKSQVSAKRWKETIGGKSREEGPCAQSIWKPSQPQCWPEW